MTLNKLIAALEAADGPSRELDGRIYCALNDGFAPSPAPYHGMVERYRGKCVRPVLIEVPAYTSSIDAALTLVPEGCGFTLSANGKVAEAEVFGGETGTSPWVIVHPKKRHPAHALCIAALKARETKK